MRDSRREWSPQCPPVHSELLMSVARTLCIAEPLETPGHVITVFQTGIVRKPYIFLFCIWFCYFYFPFFFVAFILNEIRNIDSSIEEQELRCTLIRYRSQFCICFLIVHISLYRSQWTWTWRAFDRVRNKPYLIRSFGMSNWLRGNFLPLSPLYELRTFICVSVVCVCCGVVSEVRSLRVWIYQQKYPKSSWTKHANICAIPIWL